MKWTGLNELRERYLSFFESKGHLRLPSASLVPAGDKSLLLINSGMAPLKKYFTGELTPPNVRVTTCQKCIRTPDIENVGITARHGTYFEMLGNFSFGEYFKRETIAWAWEFVTEVLEMPKELLHISVYLEDDEAYDIWTKEIGVAENHMVRLGKKDNFWEHGAGPCGPCSEIHFDRGEKHGCGSPDCAPGCECDRFMEFWNLVFTQFNSDGAGNYTELAMKNIDTGMGLERLACLMQGVDNLFEVDTVQNIMRHVMDFAGVEYHADAKKDISLRVITDHIRSGCFMIGDGVLPSNEGRGYVLRRLLRRAARHGRLLGIREPFLSEVCDTVIRENAGAYPNLIEKQDLIVKVIRREEESFDETIEMGLKLLDQMISGSTEILSGADAFKLSDTYGFPIDLIKEILAERRLGVDEGGFLRLMQEQRERSRRARQDAGADAWKGSGLVTKGLPATRFTGYEGLETTSRVEIIIVDGEKREYLEPQVNATLVLDQSPFYAESGGQAGDTGLIEAEDFIFRVAGTTKTNDGVYLHHGSIIEGEGLQTGAAVTARVDAETRRATKRNHTAAHLLQAALRNVLGSHVEQAGQFVGPEVVRFDFTHFSALSTEEIHQVERQVNAAILEAMPVTAEEMPIAKAKELGAMALFGEKYGDVVRVVRAGEVSTELCGGTHVHNTGEIGLFKIESEVSVAAGVRRITGLTGLNLLDFIDSHETLISKVIQALKTNSIQDLAQRALSVIQELRAKDREIERLKQALSQYEAEKLLGGAAEVGGLKVLTAFVENTTIDALRALCDSAKQKGADYVALFAGTIPDKEGVTFACACGAEALKRGAHAGNIIRAAAALAGGSGGGRPDSAMAGAKDTAKAKKALGAVNDIVAGMINP